MSLEKSLRALMGPAYDPTDPIAATDDEATDKALLTTEDRTGQDIVPIFEDEFWPRNLSLRVRLNPIPFSVDQHQLTSSFVANDTTCAETLFYARVHQEGQLVDSCFAGIDLVYAGQSLEYDGFRLRFLHDKAGVIYHKAFPVQRAPSVMCKQQHKGAGQWSITTHRQQPFKDNEVPIFAYGGIYQPNLPLESLVPVYATIAASADQKTQVTLKSQKFWYEKGVFETQSTQLGDTIYSFHDPCPETETQSLATLIHNGTVKITLEHEDERKIYKSVRYQSLQGLIDMTFIPTD
jgi:hypothetical protein